MPGRSIRIARIAGIPVGIRPLWLIIAGLITWSLGVDCYPSEIQGIAPLSSCVLGLGGPEGIVSVTDIERLLRAVRIGSRRGTSRRLAPHGSGPGDRRS